MFVSTCLVFVTCRTSLWPPFHIFIAVQILHVIFYNQYAGVFLLSPNPLCLAPEILCLIVQKVQNKLLSIYRRSVTVVVTCFECARCNILETAWRPLRLDGRKPELASRQEVVA